MGRKPCCEKGGVNRGAWTAMEDKILTDYISLNGEGKWRNLPISAGLKRCGKSCRLRWLNYLKPDIKRGNITREEEDLIIRLHKLLGNRWSLIAGRLPGRTDNEIKNYWNTNIGKKLQGHDQNKPRCLSSPSLRYHQKTPTPTPTRVVRTRATRCTKVVIPEELQNFKTKDNDEIEKKTYDHITINNNNNNNNNNSSMETVGALEQGPVWALDQSIPSDMKIDKDVDVDMDMDGHILSKILDAHEFLPFSDLQYHHHHQQQQQQRQNEGRMSSPLMNDNLFLGEDVEGELDIDWITSFLETELIEETSH